MNRPGSQIYLDYCATTPADPEVVAAMMPALEGMFGNPSSMHWAGRQAMDLKEQSRRGIASVLGCLPDESVFTSGATEADNLALFGIMKRFSPNQAHLITSSIEHHAVLHAAAELEKEGYAVTYLPVDSDGIVHAESLHAALRPETKLVSIMLVNNEIGSIQPIKELSSITHKHGALFHTDAVQGLFLEGQIIPKIEPDLLSLSGHKVYGPKGIGALYIRKGIEITPQLLGGPQENGHRAGTENIPGILGLAAALERVGRDREIIDQHLHELRSHLAKRLAGEIPEVVINGDPEYSASHIVSARFPGAIAEMMLLLLSQAGIAVSLGSACTSRDIEPSHVLLAMMQSHQEIESTLRISMGNPTTLDEIDLFMDVLPGIYHKCLTGGEHA